ncbi:MAG TPA: polymer-forming cytoskeletal protein [Myxococcales bacterium]|nr:polymer-forming cytoskeletal protein [Myxococcales bacterium]HIM02396.1 polymer-forming cytoskeletal protein [Myxococcales bacterium]
MSQACTAETALRDAPTLVVRAGAAFDGLLTCPKAARIEGRFTGNVFAEGRIEIGEAAEVTGRIEAQDIVIAGRFEGELEATRCISLLATARVQGELCARELIAEEGCMVTGRCRTIPPRGV